MYKFVVAREAKGKKPLPGNPVAQIRSTDPAFNGAFLCTVLTPGLHTAETEKDLTPAKEQAARKKVNKTASLLKAFAKKPHAIRAAKEFATDSSDSDSDNSEGSDSSDESESSAGSKRHRESSEFKFDPKPVKKCHAVSCEPSEPAFSYLLPPNATFEQLPCVTPGYRTTGYVPGKSGSGKSTHLAGIIRRVKALNPSLPVYGVCKTKFKDDPVYADLGIKQLPVSFFNSGMDWEKSFGDEGCSIIFDDWDSMSPGDLATVEAAIKDALNLGRKLKISVFVTSHLLTNYKQTRSIIHEADYITLFPLSCQPNALRFFCDKIGVPREVTARLKHMGRWVTFHNTEPVFVLSEHSAEML